MTDIALVHDWLNQYGGAERVLESLHAFFPAAPIYTSMYWRDGMPPAYRTWDIRTTWMDHLPGVYHHHQRYLPFYALAFGWMDLRDQGYDLVLTNKSGFCHAVRTGDVPQLCYCLAPTRYVWEYETYAAREQLPAAVRIGLKPLVLLLRRWDYTVSQRPTIRYLAISREIQARIRRYYGRTSEIIYPPVNVERFRSAADHDDYYLIVSRLIPYKRIDLAVKAFNRLGLPLRIAGKGRDREALEAMAAPNVEFLGYVPDEEVGALYARCRALIFPGREDFGITPVEAQAEARPVIAYSQGGALDTVVPGETGAFFHEPTVEALVEAVRAFDAEAVDPLACRANAERFSVERFRREILAAVQAQI